MQERSRKFDVGDTVMLLINNPDGNAHLLKGDIGIVVGYNDLRKNWVRVDWGKDVNGHDCGGACKSNNGWNCIESFLMLVQEKEFEPCTFDELIELIGAERKLKNDS